MEQITDDIVEKGVEAFCPASVKCPKNQRTELILKLVSETFHERALRYRGRFSNNSNAFADYSQKAPTVLSSNAISKRSNSSAIFLISIQSR